jgi:hypothetical protein
MNSLADVHERSLFEGLPQKSIKATALVAIRDEEEPEPKRRVTIMDSYQSYLKHEGESMEGLHLPSRSVFNGRFIGRSVLE